MLCGLSLEDAEYVESMLFKNGKPTNFYLSYVRDIQTIIGRNARAEFEAIWRENIESGKPRSTISTELSTTLNKLSEELEATDLFSNEQLRSAVLGQVFPPTLIKKVGLAKLIERIPEAYARSAFAAKVAASFVYANGPNASHVDFYKHVSTLLAQPTPAASPSTQQ